jgi:hypothetical protein
VIVMVVVVVVAVYYCCTVRWQQNCVKCYAKYSSGILPN